MKTRIYINNPYNVPELNEWMFRNYNDDIEYIVSDPNKCRIKDKAPWWNELVTLYEVWKNNLDVDYVGFCHYRRLFNVQQVKQALELKPDIIVSSPAGIGQIGQQFGIEVQYKVAHSFIDFDFFKEYLKESSLVQFNEADFEKWLKCKILPAPYQMFVAKKSVFEDYCHRLFIVVEDFWKKRGDDIKERDEYQCRAIAFLAERFLSWYVWMNFAKKNFDVVQIPIEFYQEWKPVSERNERSN